MPAIDAAPTVTRAPSGPVIYYRDPDGKPIYALEPRQTTDGRPYRAVLASEDVSFDPRAKAAASYPARREAGFSTTAIRWAFPTFPRARRRT